MNTTTIGLDIAKTVFQVHGVDAFGKTTLQRRLRRGQLISFFANLPPCLVGIEACASAHYWARELRKFGHEVKLMPPQFVKARLERLAARCHPNVVAVALANKLARIVWALLAHDREYRADYRSRPVSA